MVTHPKALLQSDLKVLVDAFLIGLGIVGGGLAALIGLWLWLDYQFDPTNSLLAVLSTNLVVAMPASVRSLLANEAQLMDLPLTGQTSAYWYMARAGGIVAYLLLWLSTIWGLILSTKVTARLIPAPVAYGAHEFLALLAVLFTALHAGVLLGDEYIKFNIFHLAFPFTAPYEPVWTGMGTIALYLSITMTGSFYVRKQIGQKLWRTLHYFTFVAYTLALSHGLMAGSDSSLLIMKFMYLGTGLSVLFLIFYRLLTLRASRTRLAPIQAQNF
jgi:sulfoxide reductase heme-binding subunit YedZ